MTVCLWAAPSGVTRLRGTHTAAEGMGVERYVLLLGVGYIQQVGPNRPVRTIQTEVQYHNSYHCQNETCQLLVWHIPHRQTCRQEHSSVNEGWYPSIFHHITIIRIMSEGWSLFQAALGTQPGTRLDSQTNHDDGISTIIHHITYLFSKASLRVKMGLNSFNSSS